MSLGRNVGEPLGMVGALILGFQIIAFTSDMHAAGIDRIVVDVQVMVGLSFSLTLTILGVLSSREWKGALLLGISTVSTFLSFVSYAIYLSPSGERIGTLIYTMFPTIILLVSTVFLSYARQHDKRT